MNSGFRFAFLISGGGSTLASVLQAIRDGTLTRVVPALVIASRSSAGGLERAKALMPNPEDVIVLKEGDYPCAEAYGDAINAACSARDVDGLSLNGFLRRVPLNVIERYGSHIYNQHPGALDTGYPDFGGEGMYGLRVHYVAVHFAHATGRLFTEATVHRLSRDGQYDRGPIVGRSVISVYPDDTPETLQRRVLPCEHLLVKEHLRRVAHGQVLEWERERRLIRTPTEAWLLGALMTEARQMKG